VEEKADMNNFCRKLKLTELFHGVEGKDESLIRPKSNFSPPDGRNDFLDTIVHLLKQKPQPVKNNKGHYNISNDERNALHTLKQNEKIIIKEADKGSAVVIMDVDYYVDRVEEIISSTSSYQELTSNIDKQIMNRINTALTSYKNELTENELKYLTKFEYKTSNFYGLPKIHKSDTIKSAVINQNSDMIITRRPFDLKLRPIVAGPICPTHRLSHFIDTLLQPLVSSVQSWVRDDLHVLQKLPHHVETNYKFATFDVESLYSNITHKLGIEAVQFWLTRIPRESKRISNEFILNGIQLILENNTFHFNGKNYRQLLGTAMGTKTAPTYATLTLGFLELTLYKRVKLNYALSTYEMFKENYFRYLDDILIIYDTSKMPLNHISSLLNDLHENLNFKLETSGRKVNFIDITINVEGNVVETDMFYKPTDTKQYLNFHSNHPRHVKIALPYNLARRICTIVSNENIRYNRLNEMKGCLKKCNYPKQLIEDGITKALSFNRSDLITCTGKDKTKHSDLITHVSTYNPNYSNCKKIINETFNILQQSEFTTHVYKDKKILSSTRQPPSLKTILTQARFDPNGKRGVHKCHSPRCKLCETIITGDSYLFKSTNCNFSIKEFMTCDVSNCIYVLNCCGCSKIYIGETNNLRLRTNLHRDHASKNKGLGVSRHIYDCTNSMSILNKFQIMPFYKLHIDDTNYRRSMETHFIKKFKPELNRLL
jgi:hypothetical protein